MLLAGTDTCHPVPVCTAIRRLRKLMDPAVDAYGHLERLAVRLQVGQKEIFLRRGVSATVSRIGSASCVYCMDRAPRNWWEVHGTRLDGRRAICCA